MAKVMVSIPDDLLIELDRTARQRGTTRSGLLADAARRELRRRDAASVQAALERMQERAAILGVPTSEDVLAAKTDRDARR